MKKFDEFIDDLEGIVWEAREQGFFSIDDVEDVATRMKNYKLEYLDQSEKPNKDLLRGAVAWFMIPIFLILLPFAWLYSFFFQK